MKCPVCPEIDLVMTERQGVEIDYCPKCRGIWLDRGELDKIVDRSADMTVSSAASRMPVLERGGHRKHDDDGDDDYHHGKQRKSWLRELFD